MKLPHDAHGHVFTELDDVVISVLSRRTVVEHKHHARHRQRQEQEKRDAPHAPCIAQPHTGFPNADRMQMKKDIAQDGERLVAPGIRIAVAEDRPPELYENLPQPGDEL